MVFMKGNPVVVARVREVMLWGGINTPRVYYGVVNIHSYKYVNLRNKTTSKQQLRFRKRRGRNCIH
jgi:hypothetical protein